MIWPIVAPSAFMIPISCRFCTVTVISVFMIPNAATTTIKKRRKVMTVRSRRTASKYCRFISIQVWAYSEGSSSVEIAALIRSTSVRINRLDCDPVKSVA